MAVTKYKLWDGSIEPETARWGNWTNISHSAALFFYAVPRVGQNSFPQFIEVQHVRIETPQSSKWTAHIRLYNPTPPHNIPQEDVCFYTLYMVAVD
jgi:hypothetical protein